MKYKKYFNKFIKALDKRMQQGFKEYGDDSFSRHYIDILREIKQEFIDAPGWGEIGWSIIEEMEKRWSENIFVYIAAPYTKGDVVVNVRNVINVADDLIRCGFTPIVPPLSYPHNLSHFWHFVKPHTYNYWIKYDLKLLSRCDALLRLDGESKGSDKEIEYAKKNNIAVFYKFEDLLKWSKLEKRKNKEK